MDALEGNDEGIGQLEKNPLHLTSVCFNQIPEIVFVCPKFG